EPVDGGMEAFLLLLQHSQLIQHPGNFHLGSKHVLLCRLSDTVSGIGGFFELHEEQFVFLDNLNTFMNEVEIPIMLLDTGNDIELCSQIHLLNLISLAGGHFSLKP